MLATQVMGTEVMGTEVMAMGNGPPLALVHGFTQTARSWAPLAKQLARRRRVVLVDAPGHGRSAGERLGLWEAGRAVLEATGTADLMGYSMGGRICLHAALADPVRVRRLILIGVTSGLTDPTLRGRRRSDDLAMAEAIERGGEIGLRTFLEEWLRGPLFVRLGPDATGLEDRLTNTATGLASSLRLCGTGAQEPLDDRLHQLTMPVLLVVGEHDTKFRAEADRLQAAIPSAITEVIPDAGHACHLERPDEFLAVCEDWLTSSVPTPG